MVGIFVVSGGMLGRVISQDTLRWPAIYKLYDFFELDSNAGPHHHTKRELYNELTLAIDWQVYRRRKNIDSNRRNVDNDN